MKTPAHTGTREGAFSLVEIMVAISVLALLLVLLLQVVNGTLMSSQAANQQMDTTASARRALDVMASDIQDSVIGTKSTILGGTTPLTRLAMLTQGRGPVGGGGVPRFLAVQYALTDGSNRAPDTIQRSYSAVDWIPTDLLAAATVGTGGTSNLSSGVLALSIQAVLENGDRREVSANPGAGNAWAISAGTPFPDPAATDGEEVPAGFNALVPATPPTPNPLTAGTARVTALEITLVAVDDQNYRLLQKTGRLDATRSAFAATGTDLPAARWTKAINDLSNVPRPAQTAMRVLSRTVQLP